MPQPLIGSALSLFNGAITPPGIPSSGDVPPPFPPDSKSAMNEIFFGPNGLRAGWRLLIFAAIIATFLTTLRYGGKLLSHGHPPQRGFSMAGIIVGEAIVFFAVLNCQLDYGQNRRTHDWRLWTARAQGVPKGILARSDCRLRGDDHVAKDLASAGAFFILGHSRCTEASWRNTRRFGAWRFCWSDSPRNFQHVAMHCLR